MRRATGTSTIRWRSPRWCGGSIRTSPRTTSSGRSSTTSPRWTGRHTCGTFDDPGYGRLLATKLVLVVASIALAAVHGILASRNPRTARPAALAGLGTSLGVVVFATALVP